MVVDSRLHTSYSLFSDFHRWSERAFPLGSHLSWTIVFLSVGLSFREEMLSEVLKYHRVQVNRYGVPPMNTARGY